MSLPFAEAEFSHVAREEKNPKHFIYSTLESKGDQEFSTAATWI